MKKLTADELFKIYVDYKSDERSSLLVVQDAVLAAKEQRDWIPISEGVTYPCFVSKGHMVTIAKEDCGNLATHFLPITLPKPPKPEPSAMEKAFRSKYPNANWSCDSTKHAWQTWQHCWPIAQQQKGGAV